MSSMGFLLEITSRVSAFLEIMGWETSEPLSVRFLIFITVSLFALGISFRDFDDDTI